MLHDVGAERTYHAMTARLGMTSRANEKASVLASSVRRVVIR